MAKNLAKMFRNRYIENDTPFPVINYFLIDQITKKIIVDKNRDSLNQITNFFHNIWKHT